ncbi:H(+)-transporting V1 sector ATPase subunit H [Malassezia nana]|uniref:H(+)-transporting V1 sector ATPase subunit H n=1 Tax=Malassezia nana TaxID=180528 RepID=A0AAF0EHP7_9BASI|nr:H(+)-transporting V1 sector ATPase subunit H [Malassezia nana]
MAAQQESRGPAVAFSTSSLLPIENTWLMETTEKLRLRPTAWEGYERAGLVTRDEVSMLRLAEQAGQQGDLARVCEKGEAYAALYVKLLGTLSRVETIQTVLLLLDDLVQAEPDHLDWLLTADAPAPLRKILDAEDSFVSLKAAQFLTLCLVAQGNSLAIEMAYDVMAYIKRALAPLAAGEQSNKAEGHAAPIVLCIASEMLRSARGRTSIWAKDQEMRSAGNADSSLIHQLLAVLRCTSSSANTGDTTLPQLHYQALYCLWLLTFDEAAAQGLDLYYGAAPVLVQVAQRALKHKVVRMVLSIWRNMLVAAEETNASRLLGAKVLPLCATLEERRYPDKEMQDDLSYIAGVLRRHQEQMSSYEQYRSELYSGRLSFDNPAHALEDFWRENAVKLTEDHDRDLKQLVQVLQSKDADATTLAAACSDVGHFVQHMDGGRRRVDSLGAKAAIMQLVEHTDANVQFHALQTLARLVSTSWR